MSVKSIAMLLAIVVTMASCSLPITHNHPDFGPHYGDGGG
jgi:hypothetical protein